MIDVASVLVDMKVKGVIGKYAVGGASAVAFYTEPIATKDLDIFFLFEPQQSSIILSLEPIYDYCRENGYTYDHEFIIIGGWPVQFVESGHDPLWSDALAKSVTFKFDGESIDVLPHEHLAAMWATVARPKDILKIQHFAESGVLDPVKLKDILVRFDLVEGWRKIQGGLPNELKF
ncbi:MAG: hypothetical protein HOP17_00555 [Acidobacteria bacterium]|nr:hypothetical protein [Acidobacteriota bacterium]